MEIAAVTVFYVDRSEDASGVSGTGRVAAGVKFPSGRCVIEWLVEPYTMGMYQSIDEVVAVHGHDGKTLVTIAEEVTTRDGDMAWTEVR